MIIRHDYTADVQAATAVNFVWQELNAIGENQGYVTGDIDALVTDTGNDSTKVVIAQGEPAAMTTLAAARNAEDPVLP